jgi:hypothetical protein
MPTASAIKSQLIEEMTEDHIPLSSVIREIRDQLDKPTADEVRRSTIGLLEELLASGDIETGFPSPDGRGFEPWDLPPPETVERISREWGQLRRDPIPGEIAWFTSCTAQASSGPSYYNKATCELFVKRLGDKVLPRARIMFELILRNNGKIDSQTLKSKIPGAKTTSHLSSLLTNPLKHRAHALNLPYPWIPFWSSGRMAWSDYDGISGRMQAALIREINRRGSEEMRQTG